MSSPSTRDQASSQRDQLTRIIDRYLKIDRIKMGTSQDRYLAVYQGLLRGPAVDLYDPLAEALKPYQITPLFRNNNGKHAVILREGLYQPEKRKSTINIILFVITFLSVIFAGVFSIYEGPLTADLAVLWPNIQPILGKAIAFAVSLLGILTAHEFGHYFAARRHRTKVTLPYFIPFPISPFGTMGAFIRLQEPPKNKRVLLDIGLAGPLAGLIVAVPILIYGLSISEVKPLPFNLQEYIFEGNSLLYLGAKYLVHGEWLPRPVSFQGLPPFLYWIRYFFSGMPLPRGGLDVELHPVAWAGWAGLLVTSLNLLPAGQLDGGHLVYSLFGQESKKSWPYIIAALVLLGFMWPGWWLWAVLILFLGRMQAEPLDEITELDPLRVQLARLGLVIFVLVFTPVPLIY
jgi:Zn-dependent protease